MSTWTQELNAELTQLVKDNPERRPQELATAFAEHHEGFSYPGVLQRVVALQGRRAPSKFSERPRTSLYGEANAAWRLIDPLVEGLCPRDDDDEAAPDDMLEHFEDDDPDDIEDLANETPYWELEFAPGLFVTLTPLENSDDNFAFSVGTEDEIFYEANLSDPSLEKVKRAALRATLDWLNEAANSLQAALALPVRIVESGFAPKND